MANHVQEERRGWRWAYRKIRAMQVGRLSSAYRATLYWLRGDSGRFSSHGGWMRTVVRRREP